MSNLLDAVRVMDWTQAHHGGATGYMLGGGKTRGPKLGQHPEEMLLEQGYTLAGLEELHTAGII